MEKLLLCIDIGTSGCKISLFNDNFKVINSVVCEYKTYYPKDGYAEQNPDEWWNAVVEGIHKVCVDIDTSSIVGIGVDGQSWSAIPIDKYGKVLYNTPIWYDVRSKDICDELILAIGEDKIFEICKNPMQPTYTLPKILWLKKNQREVYDKTYKILQSNSFIVYRLTGKLSQDKSQSYGYQCYDIAKGLMDVNIANEMGLDLNLVPEIFECSDIIGEITDEVATLTGLIAGTKVIAGGLDAACGTLGVGVINEGEAQEQSGQAGGMSICVGQPIGERNLILSNHVIPSKWLLQGGTVGGAGVLKWLEQEFNCECKKDFNKFDVFCEQAEKVTPGSEGVIFLPYMAGERSPIWDSKAKGVYYGLDYSKTKGHFIRAGLEGVAFSLKHNLEVAKSVGVNCNELTASGGATKSKLWMQIKADVCGKIIHTASDISTTLGVAMLTGVGVGLFQNYDEAKNIALKYLNTYVPQRENENIYNNNYKKYLKLYVSLKDLV